jgi:hypothetical protein
MRSATRTTRHDRVDDAPRRWYQSKWAVLGTAYLLFAAVIFGESWAEALCEKIGGLPFAFAAFTVVGGLLGLVWLWWVSAEWQLKDPIFGFARTIYQRLGRYGTVGLLVYGSGVVGCMGVGAVAKMVSYPRPVALTLAPAIPFALIWVPIFHYFL